VDPVRYQTVGACLRAPRFIVAYRPGPDWIYTARRVVESLSRVWGGVGAVVLPVDSAGIARADLFRMVRTYDPDIIAAHTPIMEDLAQGDPSVIQRMVQRLKIDDESDEEAWDRISVEPHDDESWEALAGQVDEWCSPLKGLHQDVRSFPADEIYPFPRHGEADREFAIIPPLPDERIFTLDLSAVDPTLALMIESRVGALDARGHGTLHPIELPVENEDLVHLVRLAITGEAPRGWDLHTRYLTACGVAITGQPPSALTGEQYLQQTPFARTDRWLIRVRTAGAPKPPVVCVVGDTAADHALRMLCDRLFHRASWVPLDLLRQDDRLGRAARTAVHRLRYVPDAPPRRPVLVTSVSEPHEAVRDLVSDLEAMFGTSGGDAAFVSVRPDELALETTRSFLADPTWFALTRTVPVRRSEDEVLLLAPIDLPMPQAVEHLSPDLRWHIDVSLPGHLPPARTALSSDGLQQNLPGSIPDTVARAGRYGISFSSANMGSVPAGVPVEGRLAHPLLRFPSAEQIFTELAAARGATAQRSSAGRRAANAAELWRSFDAIVADLTGPTRRLLDAFLPPDRQRDGDYQSGYAIRGDGYLTFNHAAAALGTETGVTRATLDRLLGLNVLRRGLLLSCERCRWQAFYPIDQVGRSFVCAACSHTSGVAQGSWYKGDPEPAWNYGLDQVVRDLLRQHGDLPILTAAHLRRDARDFLWAPELAIEDATGEVELDACLIIDGRVVVGEAKSNGQLGSGRRGTGQASANLVRIAQLLTADEIVLATSKPAWAPGAIPAVERALAAGWQDGPTPKITELVNVGK